MPNVPRQTIQNVNTKILTIESQTLPVSADQGAVVRNSADNSLYQYIGSSWTQVGGGTGSDATLRSEVVAMSGSLVYKDNILDARVQAVSSNAVYVSGDQTLNGTKTFSGVVVHNNVRTEDYLASNNILSIGYPGALNSDVSSISGALAIILPGITGENAMIGMRIVGYNFDGLQGHWQCNVGGYHYGATNVWMNLSADVTGTVPFSSVRFGRKGANFAILLGNQYTAWKFPFIVIERLTVKFTNRASYANVVNLEILSSGESAYSINQTIVANRPWSTTFQGSGTGMNSDTLDGYHLNEVLFRSNHTGTQTAGTISDFDQATADALASMNNFNTLAVNSISNNIQVIGLYATDARNVPSTPGDYDYTLKANFKTSVAADTPFPSTTYVHLLGYRAWADDSAGKAHELAFGQSGGIAYRSGTEAGGWGNWQMLTPPIKPFALSYYGGDIYVNEGSLVPPKENTYWTFSGGNITAPTVDGTYYVCVDLYTLDLHILKRKLHDGCIWLGEVYVSGGAVTEVTDYPNITFPKSAIEKTKYKLANSSDLVKVAVVGDSLSAGAGTGTAWTELLFNSAYSGSFLNAPNLSLISYHNYAVGGTTSHYGEVVANSRAVFSGSGEYILTQYTYDSLGQLLHSSSENQLLTSPFVRGAYDLVILGFGANGGTDQMRSIENIVRTLRAVGTEVILITENHRTDNTSYLQTLGFELRAIADAYGCAIADTWAYVREAYDAGTTTHADVIHMASAGHTRYAQAIRSVFNEFQLEPHAGNQSPIDSNHIHTSTNYFVSRKHHNFIDFQVKPYSTTGSLESPAVVSDYKNPAIWLGGVGAQVVSCTSGQIAKYGHIAAKGFTVLVDSSSAFTAHIKTQNQGLYISTLNYPVSATNGNGVALLGGSGIGVWSDITSGSGSNTNSPVQFEVVSGTMKIYGVGWQVWKNEQKNLDAELIRIGTWSKENSDVTNTWYTDTTNDTCVIEWEGTAALVAFNSASASGIIDITLDGKPYLTGYDLYLSGAYTNSILITPAKWDDYYDRHYGRHVAKIKLVGVGGSAGATSAGNRRLCIKGLYIMDGR